MLDSEHIHEGRGPEVHLAGSQESEDGEAYHQHRRTAQGFSIPFSWSAAGCTMRRSERAKARAEDTLRIGREAGVHSSENCRPWEEAAVADHGGLTDQAHRTPSRDDAVASQCDRMSVSK